MSTMEDAAPAADGMSAAKRAIVVEDSRATRSLLRRELQRLGYDVLEAGNGAEGLDVLRGVPPVDLVLVNWNMPVMNGLEFVRALRTQHAFANTIVMMVSAENDRSMVAQALRTGADDYVIKPLTPEIISIKLEMLRMQR